MKKVLSVVLACCAVIGFAQVGFAQAQRMAMEGARKPGPAAIESVTSTAIVDAIDYENRTGTIKLPDGTMVTFKAGPEVRDFEQVKVGDQVLIRK